MEPVFLEDKQVTNGNTNVNTDARNTDVNTQNRPQDT